MPLVTIQRLGLKNIRPFKEAEIHLEKGINLITGKNGAGKTTILEAIALVSYGRSFNTANNAGLITFGEKELIASTAFTNKEGEHKAGISIDNNGNKSIRLDEENKKSMQQLAKALPVTFVTPKSFNLLEGSSKERRRFIDWLAFHVKPEFNDLAAETRKLLVQRNTLLKQNPQRHQIAEWNKAFAEKSKKMHEVRKEVFKSLCEKANKSIELRLNKNNICLSENPGWNNKTGLLEQLEADFELDKKRGYTNKGAHKYDLDIFVENKKAAQVLSRGEKKTLILALIFSQIEVAKEYGVEPLLAIDDLASELDEERNKQAFDDALKQCDQIIITGTNKGSIYGKPSAMFHVEHGKILRY